MVPYVRNAYWRWWLLPEIPGTKWSEDLFDPFNRTTGGLFWYDKAMREETRAALKKGKPFQPVVIIDKTYQIQSLKD
jgi:microcin C transport system substrate-binding protein